MSKLQDIRRLQLLAALKLEASILVLAKANHARQISMGQLAGLATEQELPADMPEIVGRRAEMTYQRWAEGRRAEINVVLARQTADWLTAQDAARAVFGQTEALKAIVHRMKKGR